MSRIQSLWIISQRINHESAWIIGQQYNQLSTKCFHDMLQYKSELTYYQLLILYDTLSVDSYYEKGAIYANEISREFLFHIGSIPAVAFIHDIQFIPIYKFMIEPRIEQNFHYQINSSQFIPLFLHYRQLWNDAYQLKQRTINVFLQGFT